MEDLLNVELVKLQDELVQLDKAVSHISKAEQLTEEVINSSREIQQKYIAQLQNIQDRYNEYLEKSRIANEDKLDSFASKQQEQVNELNNTLTKYTELAEKTENIASNNLEKSLQQYGEFLKKTSTHTEQNVQSLVDAHLGEINEVRKLIQDYRSQLEKQEEMGIQQLEGSMRHNSELLKKALSVTEEQVTNLTNAHKNQIEEINQVFQSYIDLSDSTSQLAREIRSVEFPTRLTTIADDVSDFKNTVRNTFARIEAVERNVAKVNQIDWSTITGLHETITQQNKKINAHSYILYITAALALVSVIFSFIYK